MSGEDVTATERERCAVCGLPSHSGKEPCVIAQAREIGRLRACIRRLFDTDQGTNLAISESNFLTASMAVWREIDRLEAEGDYPGIDQGTDLRRRERAAWDAYRAALDG